MNPDASNETNKCLSDAAKSAERKRLEEQTYDKLDVIACERTRMIAEALINQLTNEDDGQTAEGRNAERINKLRDSSKLFEPLRERKEPIKSNRQPTGEPAKKLLRELLEQANAQLRVEENSDKENGQPSCDADSGCQAKLTTEQIQTIVLQSSTTSVDLEAQQAKPDAAQNGETGQSDNTSAKPMNSAPALVIPNLDAKAPKPTKSGKSKAGVEANPNKNILSLISQSEVMVNDAMRKASGSLKKLKG